LDSEKLTILAIGGSLGARTINESINKILPEIAAKNYQIIWQTGRNYNYTPSKQIEPEKIQNIFVQDFIFEMPQAYAAADIIISRAGAIAVSEIIAMAKPVIFIPSPNVTDDHQTKNATALVNQNAAILLKDSEAYELLGEVLFDLIDDENKRNEMSNNLKKLAMPNAAEKIAEKILELRENK